MGDTWLCFEARRSSASDTGTTQTTVTGTGKMTRVSTTKKKQTVGFLFFYFFGVFHWVKRNERSFTNKRPIKAQQCFSYSSNPGLSIAGSASL
jgi:hypothetical protein